MQEEEIFELAVGFRRHFHCWPEVSTQEFETQAFITGVLQNFEIPYQVVGTGIIAQIGEGEKCVALRTDMDALWVSEETGLEYSSSNPGIMHACGHDMHTAMLLGAALVLKSQERDLKGTVKLVFQPSEEKRPGGARLLLPYLMEEPKPQAILGNIYFPDYL